MNCVPTEDSYFNFTLVTTWYDAKFVAWSSTQRNLHPLVVRVE
jgi:hypothetical protein